MNPNYHPFYRHSGKFGMHGPVFALLAGAVAALPLGLAYSYLIKWIPFEDYCALSVANVTVTPNKDGKMKEQVTELMTNLWVPKTMFDYLAQFDHISARVGVGV